MNLKGLWLWRLSRNLYARLADDIKNACINLKVSHLVVHGSDDPTVSISDAYDFKKWNSNTEIFEINNANHVFGIMHPYTLDKYPKDFQLTLDKTFEFLKA